MSAPALHLDAVACTFVDRADPGRRYTAVRDVTLTVGAGEFVSVVGPTGCGKSTLLNVSAGLLQPSTGSVKVFGETLQGLNRRAGYMFQAESLMPWRTALGNVMAGLEFRGAADATAQAERWLRRVGLGGFGDRYPHQLSGGMRKRVSLAQTLALDPDIILMDEPFSALDIQTRQLMENEVLALWQEKRKAVLFITHDLDEAIAMSDRVVVLSAGPGSHPIGEFSIDIPRPRDVAEIKTTARFIELHAAIWAVLRDEVLKGYAQQLQAA
jgi:NitT/TauT family transport system ATP-binding protein